jgi:SCY1-like protein 1
LGKDLPADEYTATIIGPVVNLFATPDRGTRMALLDGLPEFADKLDKNTVVNKVWPHLVSIALRHLKLVAVAYLSYSV